MKWTVGLAAGAMSLAMCSNIASAEPANSFAITNIRVFDGDKILQKTVVVVRDGHVAALGPSAKLPPGIPVVDGAGKTLLPGLIDAHTHTFGEARADALRFGVTTELDMFTHPSVLRTMVSQRESLARTGESDLYSAGVLATAPHGHGTEYGFPIPTLTTAGEADAWVRGRLAEGSDYIKIIYEPDQPRLPSLDAATLAALVKAAHAHGKMAVVHISTLAGARTALEAGADGLMHAFADKPADAAFYRLAAAHKAFVVPTLSVISGIGGGDEGSKLAADPHVAPYLSAEQVGALQSRPHSPSFHYDVAAGEVAALKAAHIDILAGTDAGNPTTAHGATLHEEMALLVAAGLSPIEALRAATSTPAKRFGLAGRGRIGVGDRADLVLVDGDPTLQITATRAIVQIWKNGYPVDRRPAKRDTPSLALSGSLGDFETGLSGPNGAVWQATSDKLVGGASEAAVSREVPGAAGSQGALHVEGLVKAGPVAWGGAQLQLGTFVGSGRDIGASAALVFRVRGDRPQGLVMLFDAHSQRPIVCPFVIAPEWREVRLPLASFSGANLKAIVGLAITTNPTPGAFSFAIDDVRLE